MSVGGWKYRFVKLTLLGLVVFVAAMPAYADEPVAERVTFDKHVKPIFREKCVSCHNSDDREGELDLSSYAATFEGGAAGAVVERGDSLNSSLFALITHETEPAMPPEAPKISSDMIDTIKRWIESGALENAGSQVEETTSRGLPVELSTRATGQPDVPPMPLRLSLEPVVQTERGDVVRGLAVNPWSPLAAVASPKQVLLYHTETLEPLGVLPFPEGVPEVLRFSRSGAILLAGGGRGGAQGGVVAWDVRSGERVAEVGDELDTVLAADISSDHALIAMGGPKRVVRVYSTEDGSLRHELRKHVEWIYDLQFSPDAALLATADRNGSIVIWEAYSGREYLTLKGHGRGRISLSWRADSNVLASCGADGAVRLWEMEKGEQVGMWKAHGKGALSVTFTKDGRLVTCGKDNKTKLWNADGKIVWQTKKTKAATLRTAFCETTGRVLTGDFAGKIALRDGESKKVVGRFRNNPPTLAMRLQSAEQELARYIEKSRKNGERYQQLLAESKAAHEAAEQVPGLDDAKRRVDAARTVLMFARQRKQDLDKDIVRLKKRIAQIEKGLPNLQEAVRRADRSIKDMGGDPEVREVEQQLRTLARRRLGDLNNMKRGLASQESVRRKLGPELDRAEAVFKKAVEALREIEAKIAPLRTTALAKWAKAGAIGEEMAGDIPYFSQSLTVKRWRDEIAFTEKFAELSRRKQMIASQLAIKRQRRNSLKAELDQLTQSLARSQSRLGELARTPGESTPATVQKSEAEAARIAEMHAASEKMARDVKAASESVELAEAESRRVDEELRQARRRK